MSANVAINAIAERLDKTGAIVSTIFQTARTTELGTAIAVNNFTVTPTSTNMLEGDRIRLRVYGDDSAAATMATGFTFNITVGRNAGGVDGDSWIQFTETFGLQSTFPSGTQMWLTTTAGPAVGADLEQEMWTARGGGGAATTATTAPVTGWTSGVRWTTTSGGAAIEWYSKQLTAFTLDGLVSLNIWANETNAAGEYSLRAELAVCDGDGSNAVVWASAALVDHDTVWARGLGTTSTTGELGTSSVPVRGVLAGVATSVGNGQRLRLRFYVDDNALTAAANTGNAVISYNRSSGTVDGDSYIMLPQSVTLYTPASSFVLPDTSIRLRHRLVR